VRRANVPCQNHSLVERMAGLFVHCLCLPIGKVGGLFVAIFQHHTGAAFGTTTLYLPSAL
ncbi:MAG: hypothetical protein RR075_02200, partial [Pygmaiobacter sp.]